MVNVLFIFFFVLHEFILVNHMWVCVCGGWGGGGGGGGVCYMCVCERERERSLLQETFAMFLTLFFSWEKEEKPPKQNALLVKLWAFNVSFSLLFRLRFVFHFNSDSMRECWVCTVALGIFSLCYSPPTSHLPTPPIRLCMSDTVDQSVDECLCWFVCS